MRPPEIRTQPPSDPSAYAVEWHRPDPRRGLVKAWLIGSVLLVTGAVLLAQVIYYAGEMPGALGVLLVILSVALSAAGPLLVVVTAIRSLADETCLVLRSDGLHYTGRDGSFFVHWRDIVSLTLDDENDTLRIETETDTRSISHPQFVGVSRHDLAKRIDDIRRRALLGLIRPANVWGWEEGRH
jgi:hypothetical protein